jgi:hypothetical protein
MIQVTKRDMLRNKLVTPGWYVVNVTGCNMKTAKSGTSQNYWMEGEIVQNADDGSKEFAGVPTPTSWLFNDGAPGFVIGYMIACGADENEIMKQIETNPEGVRLNPERTVGKQLEVLFTHSIWEGRTVNKIPHEYRRLGSGNGQPAQ